MDKVKQLEAAGKTNTTEYSNAHVQVKQEVLRFYVDPYRFLKDNR